MNKNLTQLGQQLAGIWKQLGFNQRVSILLATLAVLGGLGGLAFASWAVLASWLPISGRPTIFNAESGSIMCFGHQCLPMERAAIAMLCAFFATARLAS